MHCLFAVGSTANNHQARLCAENNIQPLKHDGLVIDHEHTGLDI